MATTALVMKPLNWVCALTYIDHKVSASHCKLIDKTNIVQHHYTTDNNFQFSMKGLYDLHTSGIGSLSINTYQYTSVH